MTPVLIYRAESLGDTLVALPCFHAFANVFSDRRKVALIDRPVSSKVAPLEAILPPAGLIDGPIEYPIGLWSFAALLRLRTAIRQTGSGTLIYLATSRGRWSWDEIFNQNFLAVAFK